MAHRPRSQLLHQLALFREYVTHYDTKLRSSERHSIASRSTAYRRMASFLKQTPVPLPVANPSTHTALMLDGFYLAYPSVKEHRHLPGAKTAESVLLLAIDAVTHQPLHWHIYRRIEDRTVWDLFFAELVQLVLLRSIWCMTDTTALPMRQSGTFPERCTNAAWCIWYVMSTRTLALRPKHH